MEEQGIRRFCTDNNVNTVWEYTPYVVLESSKDYNELSSCWDGRPIGRKVGGCCAFPWGAGSPSNTTLPGPRPTFVPSGILIHLAVWPQ